MCNIFNWISPSPTLHHPLSLPLALSNSRAQPRAVPIFPRSSSFAFLPLPLLSPPNAFLLFFSLFPPPLPPSLSPTLSLSFSRGNSKKARAHPPTELAIIFPFLVDCCAAFAGGPPRRHHPSFFSLYLSRLARARRNSAFLCSFRRLASPAPPPPAFSLCLLM